MENVTMKKVGVFLRTGEQHLTDEELLEGITSLQRALDVVSWMPEYRLATRALCLDLYALEQIKFFRNLK